MDSEDNNLSRKVLDRANVIELSGKLTAIKL